MPARMDVLVVTNVFASTWYAQADLARHGFTVRRTGTPIAALRAAAVRPPDIVVIDWATPGVHGLSLARALRRQPRGLKAPLLLVAITANSSLMDTPCATLVDLALMHAAPDVAGVVVGVLNGFRDFFTHLYLGADGPASDRFP